MREPGWDVAVIGAGMGGGTLGHALARRGHRVVFIERGAASFDHPHEAPLPQGDDVDQRIAKGQWPHRITAQVDGRVGRFHAPLGCGVGGSTLLYAAALERFERSDFDAPPPGAHSPMAWPIGYDSFRPFYDEAEALYRLRGTPDPLSAEPAPPLREAAPLNGCDASLATSLARQGLHPYRLHLGIDEVEGCDHCLGAVCPRQCKSDARRIAVAPALGSGHCEVISHCEALHVTADGPTAQHVGCRQGGREFEVDAKVIVLSAGAYHSPKLLLASTGPQWPRGLGNAHDQVGRNIMFHGMDMLALWPRTRHAHATPSKSLGLRDFYRAGGQRLGMLQSVGLAATYPNVLHAMRLRLERSRVGAKPLLRQLARVPAFAVSRALGSAAVFATILEDFPYADNRLVLDAQEPDGLRVDYAIPEELRRRWRLLRRTVLERLKPHRAMFINADLELNFGHPSGTCRIGDDPRSSVLDAGNRVHGLDNLYVVDASFMPTSGGANPALTVAANALRVAGIIDARLPPPRHRPPAAAGVGAPPAAPCAAG